MEAIIEFFHLLRRRPSRSSADNCTRELHDDGDGGNTAVTAGTPR